MPSSRYVGGDVNQASLFVTLLTRIEHSSQACLEYHVFEAKPDPDFQEKLVHWNDE
jgi:hypothetical protein